MMMLCTNYPTDNVGVVRTLQVAQVLVELEVNSVELKPDLRNLYISAAKKVEIGGGKSAIVVFVPPRLLKGFRKVQQRLVRELEKKFSGSDVVVIAQRRTQAKPTRNTHKKLQRRPMSRTITAVHDAILEDIVFPTEIVGKRTRCRLDGTKLLKVHLDSKDRGNVNHKLSNFAVLYKRITGKEVAFEFPVQAEE